MSELTSHRCPYAASEYVDRKKLTDIIFDDDRRNVKIECIKTIADRVINPRGRRVVNRVNMEIVYHCMVVYAWMCDVQEVGMDMFISVCEIEGGSEMIDAVCPKLLQHMCGYGDVPSLHSKVCKYMSMRKKDVNEIAEVLNCMQKRRVSTIGSG